MSAITALTAQNTTGVRAIQESTPDFLKQQLDAIFEDIYPDAVKMKKQMAYANAKNIRFVVLAGEDEISKGLVNVKNMETGEQQEVKPEMIKDIVLG